MAQNYYILSENTKFHPVTNNEADGQLVATLNGNLTENSIFTFSQDVEGPGLVIVTIQGPKGFYVALPEGAGADTKLIWSSQKYEWIISGVIGDGRQAYQIYPANGLDLYWVDKFGIGNFVIVLEGKDVVPPQNSWYLARAHD